MQILAPYFRRNWRRYLRQSALGMAGLAIALGGAEILLGLGGATAVAVGSIGSTAFLLFVAPGSDSAAPRRVIGGHGLAIVLAVAFVLVGADVAGEYIVDVAHERARGPVGEYVTFERVTGILYPVAMVGLVMLGMAAFDVQHPPAAGTALAFVWHGFDLPLILFVIVVVLGLVGAQRLLRRAIPDFT